MTAEARARLRSHAHASRAARNAAKPHQNVIVAVIVSL